MVGKQTYFAYSESRVERKNLVGTMRILSSDVRPAEMADAVSVATVHWQAWQQVYAGIIPHRSLQAMLTRRNVSWWQRAVSSEATVLVLEVQGKLVGYATVGLSRARALLPEGEIYEIYLLPEYQGLGFGRDLFTEARRLLASLGCKGTICWVLDDLQQAKMFFSALGGKPLAFSRSQFGDTSLGKVSFCWD